MKTVPWEVLGPATGPQGMNTASSRPFLLSDHRKDARKLTRPREVTTSCWPLTHCYSSRGETGLSTCFYSHSHLQNTNRCFFKNYPCLGFVLITLQKRVIGAISWEIADPNPWRDLPECFTLQFGKTNFKRGGSVFRQSQP